MKSQLSQSIWKGNIIYMDGSDILKSSIDGNPLDLNDYIIFLTDLLILLMLTCFFSSTFQYSTSALSLRQ